MQLLPVKLPILKKGDDLSGLISSSIDIEDGDILAISSKAVSTVEGAAIDLSTLKASKEAEEWAEKCGRTPEFRQAVLNEVERMNGKVLPSCNQAMLTELKPDGFLEGTLLVPNAGLDISNAEEGYAIGWSPDPVASVKKLRGEIRDLTGKDIAVILTDSGCRPRRLGVVAIALAVSGIEPFESQIGKEDLFGHDLRMTYEARADQLATASNFIMGNTDQAIPAVLIREHGLPLTDFEGWVTGVEPEEDLFCGAL